MADIKITAQFSVRGDVMYSEQECLAMEGGYDAHTMRLSYLPNPRAKELRQETVRYLTRRFRPASQVLKMSQEAYQGMLDAPPSGWRRGTGPRWEQLSEKQRVDAHMDAVAADLHAESYTYHIAED